MQDCSNPIATKLSHCSFATSHRIAPDSKVYGASMGPTWVLLAPDGPHVGSMNLVIRSPDSITFVHILLAARMLWLLVVVYSVPTTVSASCTPLVYNRGSDCSNSLAASSYPACSSMNLTANRGICELQSLNDLTELTSVARVMGSQTVIILDKHAV